MYISKTTSRLAFFCNNRKLHYDMRIYDQIHLQYNVRTCIGMFHHIHYNSNRFIIHTIPLLAITVLPYLKQHHHTHSISLAILPAVMPELGGPGGPLVPPIFGRSVNPIPTGGGQIIPTYYYWHPQCFSPSGITAIFPSFHMRLEIKLRERL